MFDKFCGLFLGAFIVVIGFYAVLMLFMELCFIVNFFCNLPWGPLLRGRKMEYIS